MLKDCKSLIRFSFHGLLDSLVIHWVLDNAEESVLTPDIVPVYVHKLAIRLVKFLVLVGKDRDFIGVVGSLHAAILILACRDAALNLSLQIVVTLLKFALVARLIVDLQRNLLLLTHFAGKLCGTLSDAALCHLVQHLQLVEELALVADQGLLFIKLFAQFREFMVVGILLILQGRLQVTLLVFLHLDHTLFRVYLNA